MHEQGKRIQENLTSLKSMQESIQEFKTTEEGHINFVYKTGYKP